MIPKLSVNAQKSFDDYLNQVKVCLKGVKSVDAEEIQQQITEHIENELSKADEPVASEEPLWLMPACTPPYNQFH